MAARFAIIGAGARGLFCVVQYVRQQVLLKFKNQPVDTTPITFDIYESQSEHGGPGDAFHRSSDGAMNSPVPSLPALDTTGLSDRQREVIEGLTDVMGLYARELGDSDGRLAELAAVNTATALLYQQARHDRGLDTSVACGPRKQIGEILSRMLQNAIDVAEKELSWVTINLHYNHLVMDIDIDNPSLPVLSVKNKVDSTTRRPEPYTLVLKTTGTSWRVPVQGQVQDNALTAVPNKEALDEYLQQKHLVDDHGHIKPGSKVLIGGAHLSAFDWIGMIVAKTDIITLDKDHPNGFIVNKAIAKQYHGLIVLFNRTDGDIATSRHTETLNVTDCNNPFTPEMMLSYLVEKDRDPCSVFMEVACLLMALQFGKLPSEIKTSKTTQEQLEYMKDQNRKLALDPEEDTELSVMRKVCGSLLLFGMISPDLKKESAELDDKFSCLTRSGFDLVRALNFEATHKVNPDPEASNAHSHAIKTFLNYIASCPFHIHNLVTALWELGVVQWQKGSYEDLTWIDECDKFCLGKIQADALIASRMLDPKADKLSEGLLSKAEHHRPGEPNYRKGRWLTTSSGKIIHVIELGMAGHGTQEGGVFRGMQWIDTSNAGSAAQISEVLAVLIRMVTELARRGDKAPLEHVEELYREILHPSSNYERQVGALGVHHREAEEILAMAQLAEAVYQDGQCFSEKMKHVGDASARRAMVEEMELLGQPGFEEARIKYEERVGRYQFEAKCQSEFERVAPDYTRKQISLMEGKLMEGKLMEGKLMEGKLMEGKLMEGKLEGSGWRGSGWRGSGWRGSGWRGS